MLFTDTLRTWYEENRRTLPWRGETDPYKIWVSEIILQQTRVQQGWNYYLRFIETFPTVQALAMAPEEQVLKVWQGLGYYSRARNMHAAAQQIMSQHQGCFPEKYDDIRALKGVGDYTAAAICSMAFQLPYPAIDGNAFRIICRIYGISDDITSALTKKKVTQICQELMEEGKLNPGTFNQAMMDFGALHCVPKNPDCEGCPFVSKCYAFSHECVDLLPVKSKTMTKKQRYFHYFFHINKGNTIIEKREGKDIWRNLYQFPMEETSSDVTLKKGKLVATQREVLTHQVVVARFYVCEEEWPTMTDTQKVVKISEIHQYPMPKIMVDFIFHHC